MMRGGRMGLRSGQWGGLHTHNKEANIPNVFYKKMFAYV